MKRITCNSFFLLIVFFSASTCFAGLDEGLAAYKNHDFETALRELKPLAEQGNTIAQLRLGDMYAIGEVVKVDNEQALIWWTKAAENGNPEAQLQLGNAFNAGDRVKRNYAQAITWYRMAAEHGYVPAQFNLANMYTGNYSGIPKDDAQTIYWWQKIADEGSPDSASMLAERYSTGTGVPKDDVKAVHFWRIAAENNTVSKYEAAKQLGDSYYNGRGIAQNYVQAANWYRKAAKKFNGTPAMKALGNMYYHGIGVPQDYAQAITWYGEAAKANDSDAQMMMGNMYERGEGVPKNLVIACAWYDVVALYATKQLLIPALLGNALPLDMQKLLKQSLSSLIQNQKDAKERVAKQLTADQLLQAKDLAKAWTIGDLIPGIQTTRLAKDSAGEGCGQTGLFSDKLQEIDGPKGVAKVGSVADMTFDSNGNLFFTDQAYHTIREIKVNGEVVKVAGQSGEYGCNDGKRSEAHLFNPYGIAVDKNGIVYFYDHNMIRKVDLDGSVTTLAGVSKNQDVKDGKGKDASFWGYQVKITLGRDDNLYVGDQSGVRKVTPDGVVTTIAGLVNREQSIKDGNGVNARFNLIRSITVDQQNNIYVLDEGAIRKIGKNGDVTTIANSDPRAHDSKGSDWVAKHCSAASLAIDQKDNIFVSSVGTIRKIDPAGKVNALVDFKLDCYVRESSDTGYFSMPRSMAIDKEGNVYGFGINGLFKVSPIGKVSLVLDLAQNIK
ncbi:SEL1-like repeat protein [Sulfuriferula nivalis]|uniref:Teneurin NHL domain-containing protein n=1 Tax=Sulfuriferula nivalis TaxID=2675298 RepID=A0A809RG25_9PROT|nr:SEL1-like repeat protein [Sulfuriferula nivalis]BBP00596.1 hypothetical protein SFSGTM_13040 [Sulfuriferula nivalis]